MTRLSPWFLPSYLFQMPFNYTMRHQHRRKDSYTFKSGSGAQWKTNNRRTDVCQLWAIINPAGKTGRLIPTKHKMRTVCSHISYIRQALPKKDFCIIALQYECEDLAGDFIFKKKPLLGNQSGGQNIARFVFRSKSDSWYVLISLESQEETLLAFFFFFFLPQNVWDLIARCDLLKFTTFDSLLSTSEALQKVIVD